MKSPLLLLLAAALALPAAAARREAPTALEKLVPYTSEEQARLYRERPPIMDAHYMMPNFLPKTCPSNLVQNVFPSATIHFIAATEFCKAYIAPATTTTTLHKTLTAWVIPGQATRSAQLENPDFDCKTLVSKEVRSVPTTSLSSACTCLVGEMTGPYTSTKTIAVAVETHTFVA